VVWLSRLDSMPAALGSLRTTSERKVVDAGVHRVPVERNGAEVEINEGDGGTRWRRRRHRLPAPSESIETTSASITWPSQPMERRRRHRFPWPPESIVGIIPWPVESMGATSASITVALRVDGGDVGIDSRDRLSRWSRGHHRVRGWRVHRADREKQYRRRRIPSRALPRTES